MFQSAFVKGMLEMLQSKGDLDRLKFMPQRIEGGNVFNFTDNKLFPVDTKDVIIFDKERVLTATRFTAALQRDYLSALDDKMSLFASTATSKGTETHKEPSFTDKILEVVASGDHKVGRPLLKELTAMLPEGYATDDLIYELTACIATRDVSGAEELITSLSSWETKYGFTAEGDYAEESSAKPTAVPEDAKPTAVPEDVKEIVEDLKAAIADKDEADIKELLEELKEADEATYKIWAAKVKGESKPKEGGTKDEEDTVADEILADLDAAFKKGDTDEITELLDELKEEVGADDAAYIQAVEKYAPKKRERRSRR